MTTTKKGMTVERVDLETLSHDPANVRKHNSKNIESIKASLKRFGQQKPIVVDGDGIVVAGNGTLEAARSLGWSSIDVVNTTLKGAEATAFAIADNRTAELAEWDDDALAQLMDALPDELQEVTGFDVDELNEMLRVPSVDVVEDEAPEPPKEPVTKRGDLILLNCHRLLCGDSTNADDVTRLMDGQHADLMATDPPYGIGYEYQSHDDSSNDVNAELVASAFGHFDCPKVWTPGMNNLDRDISRFGRSRVAVWSKKFAAAGNGLGGASVWEPVLCVGKFSVKHLKVDVIECMTDREEVDGTSLRKLHSCPKPVALYATLVESFTKRGDVVAEPFCGSGTTLIACEQLGRKCYGMEIDPSYCDVIVQRWENLTGNKAIRESVEHKRLETS